MDEWEDVKGKRPQSRHSYVVHITSSHLARGQKGNIFGDAPALAVKEQLPDCKWAMVGWGYATTGHDGGVKKYWNVVEWSAFVAWMRAYDYGKNPPPSEFTFILDTQKEDRPVDPRKKVRNYKSFTQLQAEKRREQN